MSSGISRSVHRSGVGHHPLATAGARSDRRRLFDVVFRGNCVGGLETGVARMSGELVVAAVTAALTCDLALGGSLRCANLGAIEGEALVTCTVDPALVPQHQFAL